MIGIREELNTAWNQDPSRSGEDKWQDLLGLLTAMDKKKKRSVSHLVSTIHPYLD